MYFCISWVSGGIGEGGGSYQSLTTGGGGGAIIACIVYRHEVSGPIFLFIFTYCTHTYRQYIFRK